MNSLCNVSSLQCSCCEFFTCRLCFVWRTLFCLWVGRSKRVVFGCKNPLHLFQHGLIEITGDVGAMTFEELMQELTCRSILFWASLVVDFDRIVRLPQVCPGPFLPSRDGWDL